MLRVTVEIVPFGIEERKETIGLLEIANMGTTKDNTTGDYSFAAHSPERWAWREENQEFRGKIYGVPRGMTSRHLWNLIRVILMKFPKPTP